MKMNFSGRLFVGTLLAAFLVFWAQSRLVLEQDLSASLSEGDSVEAKVFRSVHARNALAKTLFVKWKTAPTANPSEVTTSASGSEPDLQRELQEGLAKLSYSPKLMSLATGDQKTFLSTVSRSDLEAATSPEALAQVLKTAETWASLPGATGLLKSLEQDPFLLLSKKSAQAGVGSVPGSASASDASSVSRSSAVQIYERKGPLDWKKAEQLHSFLLARRGQIDFVGADLFAYENYSVAQRDIWVCTALAVGLSLLCFLWLCRTWQLIPVLICGTLASTAGGLLLLLAFEKSVSGLALAFASTFVSFNNESLIHLSGHGSKWSAGALRGVVSAIGTTVIGFLVLFVAGEGLPRQISIFSLGSLFGFLLFLLLFKGTLSQAKFRTLKVTDFRMSKIQVVLVFAMILAAGLSLGFPKVGNSLESFRYTSPEIQAAAKIFVDAQSELSPSLLNAVPVDGSALETYQKGIQRGAIDGQAFHPFKFWLAATQDDQREEWIDKVLSFRLKELQTRLESAGFRIKLPKSDLFRLPRDENDYLKSWSDVSPFSWLQEVEGRRYLLVRFLPGSKRFPKDSIELSPKAFYETVLNNTSGDLLKLFLLSVLFMALYLVPWQRNFGKILAILFPLLLALFVLQVVFFARSLDLNIAHVMALILIIGVALDYSTVLVSHDHSSQEQSKVLLTGLMTFVSFGALLFAKQPVLQELGWVVTVGSAVALVSSFFLPKEISKVHLYSAKSALVLLIAAVFLPGCQSSARVNKYQFPETFTVDQLLRVKVPSGAPSQRSFEMPFDAQLRKKSSEVLEIVLLDSLWKSVLLKARFESSAWKILQSRVPKGQEWMREIVLEEIASVYLKYIFDQKSADLNASGFERNGSLGAWTLTFRSPTKECSFPSEMKMSSRRIEIFVVNQEVDCATFP